MTNIILTGNGDVSTAEVEASVRHYTPGPREDEKETPEEVDRTPLTADELDGLSRATADTFQPIADGQQAGDRAATFVVPGEWVSPVVKQRRKQAMLLPSVGQVADLEQRVSALLASPGAPEVVVTAGQRARDAVRAARETHEGARHPDSPRYALNQDAKDATILAVAEATKAVTDLEEVCSEDAVQQEWFESLTVGLAGRQTEVADALKTALALYSEWRQGIQAAHDLAQAQGRFGEWHLHPDSRKLQPLSLVAELGKALAIATSDDDWVNGQYLTRDYDGVPPHTLAALRRSAEVAGGASYAESVYLRVASPHPMDGPVRDALAAKDLRIVHTSPVPALSNEQAQWDEHSRRVDNARS